ncbi:MAG: hypothetical protein ACLQO7_02865 [Candidatus Bathyarchaeia archaeon]
MSSNKWIVAVFKCKPSEITRLAQFYRFVDGLKGVQSLHFLVRDRIEGQVVISFRVMVDLKLRDTVKSKIANKLGTLLSLDEFAIDPTGESELAQYVAWYPEKRIENFGQAKFNQFIDLLKNMSAAVIQMIENNYFDSNQRTELAHTVSWMLGCTEYGLLSSSGMEIGYYDRIEDKYCSYLKEVFEKPSESKTGK